MIRNTNDGTRSEPYLRTDINYGNVANLPAYSSGPKGDARALHEGVKAAGYVGLQGGDAALCREFGLKVSGGGRVNAPAEAEEQARHGREQGWDCLTLHVGWGHESDLEMDQLVGAILEASAKHDLPLYIETHRATITQDTWRTVQMVGRHPEVRFNGDFSHWYTGLEMRYGDINAKFDFLSPVFERTRFMHGRIGNPGCIQVGIGAGHGLPYVDHFREMWTRSFAGFLRSARPGDYFCFAPELLHPQIYYARVFPGADGQEREESDRWAQAQVLTRIARECFAQAQQRLRAGK